jgi:hypothetical protein
MSWVNMNLLFYDLHSFSLVLLFDKVKKPKLNRLILNCYVGIKISSKYVLEIVFLQIADYDSDNEHFDAISIWFGRQMETRNDNSICLILEFGKSDISGPKKHTLLLNIFQELLGLTYFFLCKFLYIIFTVSLKSLHVLRYILLYLCFHGIL